MKIFYFVRSLEGVPSCMYNIQMLADSGYNVIVATGRSTASLDNVMKSKNIKHIDGNAKRGNHKGLNRILNRLRLTVAIRRSVKKAMKSYEMGDIVFFGTADTALAVKRLCKHSTNVLSLKELHEKPWHDRIQLEKLAPKCAAVICCETNRARVLQFRWGLNERPYVVSNKPYGYPTERCLSPTCEQTEKVIEQISHGKTIVYQARHIHFAKELVNLATALRQLGNDYQLVLIGEVDNPSDKIRISEIYPNIIWAGHIAAPMHLEITSHADIGVAVYAESSLNNLFCAPNKTYEYASFGIPSLCNDVPGLVETVGIKRAGVCVNWNDIDSIKQGVEELFNNYDVYSTAANTFYCEEDNIKKLKQIVEDVKQKRS